MNEMLQNLLYVVITTLLPILVGYAVSYLKSKRDEKLQSIENTYVKETITQATDIITNTVQEVSQTFVDNLKKEGTFNPAKQEVALKKAITQSKELLSDDATNLVIEKYNDLDLFIKATIESYIKSTK